MIVNETTRPDGLRIVTGYLPESKRIHIRFVCNRGSFNDPVGKHGTAHLFEHLMFRESEHLTTEDINMFLKRRALSWSATTSPYDITYELGGLARHVKELFGFFCELYFSPLFLEENIQSECQLVFRELQNNLKNEHRIAGTRIRQTLWTQGPYARFDDVQQLQEVALVTRDDLLIAHQQWHVPRNTTIFIVGGVDHHELCRIVGESIPMQAPSDHQPIFVHDDQYETPPTESHIIMPWPNRLLVSTLYACKYPRFASASREYSLHRYVEEMFVDGIGSRLWNMARSAKPLGYSLGGQISGEYPMGYMFLSQIDSTPADAQVALEAMEMCVEQPLGETDRALFEAVREFLLDTYETDHESAIGRWTSLLQYIAEGGNLALVEGYFPRMQEIVSSVTMEEIEGVRARVFRPERMVTLVIQPE